MASRTPAAAGRLAGLDEIDEAKRRLAAARRWESSIAIALDAAERRLREQVQDAQVHLLNAREDVEEARARLREVERRWGTIDAGEVDESPARKRQKRRHETESSFVFHRHAPPGPLGLSFFVGVPERNALVVRSVSDDSPLLGHARRHDMLIEFDGVNTEDMDIDAFRELVLARSSNGDGVRKVTMRRFADRQNLKLFLRSDGDHSD
mmetsp:Transcript_10249/g.22164  ORF Transcript_10249/g.22164 Transcript_10249/m.22164 type:complete len:208 (+) Transcript_10249:107-730(+)